MSFNSCKNVVNQCRIFEDDDDLLSKFESDRNYVIAPIRGMLTFLAERELLELPIEDVAYKLENIEVELALTYIYPLLTMMVLSTLEL